MIWIIALLAFNIIFILGITKATKQVKKQVSRAKLKKSLKVYTNYNRLR